MTDFDDTYFQRFYASPEHRNPVAKLRWYETRGLHSHQDRPIRLLDVGRGLSAFATHMSRNDAATVTATDVSAHAIARNQEADPSVNWIQAAADEEVAPPASFDVITAWDVLEHLRDPASALDAFHIMLADRGSLMVVVPVYDGVSGPIIRRLDKDPTPNEPPRSPISAR